MIKFKEHPNIKGLEVSTCGSLILYKSKRIKPKVYKENPIPIISFYYKSITLKTLSARRVVYETLVKEVDKDKFVVSVNKNPMDMRPKNLKVESNVYRTERYGSKVLKSLMKRSKLTIKQTENIYFQVKVNKRKRKDLAKELNVSPMTITRAMNRYEKILNNEN